MSYVAGTVVQKLVNTFALFSWIADKNYNTFVHYSLTLISTEKKPLVGD